MKITVCIGSSCHLKGSRQIVEELQNLIARDQLGEEVELSGRFCMGNCENGVCVTVDEEMFSLTPETTGAFFEENVKSRMNTNRGE